MVARRVSVSAKLSGEAIFKIDISDFFGSISRSRLSRVLKEYVGHSKALSLATASTVRHPDQEKTTILPYGFIQSPILASLVLNKSSLGAFLDAVHKDKAFSVTVYVDDIIVSSDDMKKLEALCQELTQRAAKSGFALSPKKSQGPATAIAAFNIELVAGKELTIVKGRLLELKTLVTTSESECQIAGLVGYVRSVNAEQADSISS